MKTNLHLIWLNKLIQWTHPVDIIIITILLIDRIGRSINTRRPLRSIRYRNGHETAYEMANPSTSMYTRMYTKGVIQEE